MSALKGLTSVFGMVTGVSPSLSSPGYFLLLSSLLAPSKLHSNCLSVSYASFVLSILWLSLRLISISPLNVSPHLHS